MASNYKEIADWFIEKSLEEKKTFKSWKTSKNTIFNPCVAFGNV